MPIYGNVLRIVFFEKMANTISNRTFLSNPWKNTGTDCKFKEKEEKQSVKSVFFPNLIIEIEKYRSILNSNAGVSKPGQPRRTQDPIIGNPFS